MKIFTIYDAKSEVHNTPFFAPTPGAAERQVQAAMRDPNSLLALYPEDYTLTMCGDFDVKTGLVTGHDVQIITNLGALNTAQWNAPEALEEAN